MTGPSPQPLQQAPASNGRGLATSGLGPWAGPGPLGPWPAVAGPGPSPSPWQRAQGPLQPQGAWPRQPYQPTSARPLGGPRCESRGRWPVAGPGARATSRGWPGPGARGRARGPLQPPASPGRGQAPAQPAGAAWGATVAAPWGWPGPGARAGRGPAVAGPGGGAGWARAVRLDGFQPGGRDHHFRPVKGRSVLPAGVVGSHGRDHHFRDVVRTRSYRAGLADLCRIGDRCLPRATVSFRPRPSVADQRHVSDQRHPSPPGDTPDPPVDRRDPPVDRRIHPQWIDGPP